MVFVTPSLAHPAPHFFGFITPFPGSGTVRIPVETTALRANVPYKKLAGERLDHRSSSQFSETAWDFVDSCKRQRDAGNINQWDSLDEGWDIMIYGRDPVWHVHTVLLSGPQQRVLSFLDGRRQFSPLRFWVGYQATEKAGNPKILASQTMLIGQNGHVETQAYHFVIGKSAAQPFAEHLQQNHGVNLRYDSLANLASDLSAFILRSGQTMPEGHEPVSFELGSISICLRPPHATSKDSDHLTPLCPNLFSRLWTSLQILIAQDAGKG